MTDTNLIKLLRIGTIIAYIGIVMLFVGAFIPFQPWTFWMMQGSLPVASIGVVLIMISNCILVWREK